MHNVLGKLRELPPSLGIIVICIFAAGCVGGVFVNALMQSSSGEVAGALGNLVGAMIGAGAAIFAVLLTIDRQRADEADKVRKAIAIEISSQSKYVVFVLDICVEIKKGSKIPYGSASILSDNLPSPIVFPALADRVGLLPYPEHAVDFYSRIAEAKSILATIKLPKGPKSEFMEMVQMQPMIPADTIRPVADCLMHALQLASTIIADEDKKSQSELTSQMRQGLLQNIHASFNGAVVAFPESQTAKSLAPVEK